MWQKIKDESPRAWVEVWKVFEREPFITKSDALWIHPRFIHPAEVVEWAWKNHDIVVQTEFQPASLKWKCRVFNVKTGGTHRISIFDDSRAAMMAGIRKAFTILEKRLEES